MEKLKNWEKFNEEIDYDSLDDSKKQFIDSLSDEKGKFLLTILLKGGEDDLMMLYEQVQDFHGIHPDMTRTVAPYTLYYSTDWWIKEKEWTLAKMRDVIQKEANNIGLNVRIVTWSMSEKDFELERDLPPKFRVMDKSKNSFKKMNESWSPERIDDSIVKDFEKRARNLNYESKDLIEEIKNYYEPFVKKFQEEGNSDGIFYLLEHLPPEFGQSMRDYNRDLFNIYEKMK